MPRAPNKSTIALPDLTPKEAADLLGMPIATFYRNLQLGRVRCVKYGGSGTRARYRLCREWVEEFRKSLESGPAPPPAA